LWEHSTQCLRAKVLDASKDRKHRDPEPGSNGLLEDVEVVHDQACPDFDGARLRLALRKYHLRRTRGRKLGDGL
jgi:hypothetical protein